MDENEDAEKSSGNHVVATDKVELDPELTDILEVVPPDDRGRIVEIIEQRQSHSGWLPPPQLLREYEDILPGLAERIVALPEREQQHRHKVIEKAMVDDGELKRRGQNYALISLFALLAVAVLLIALGEYRWGAMIAIFGIAGVVGIFVTGKVADVKSAKSAQIEPDTEE